MQDLFCQLGVHNVLDHVVEMLAHILATLEQVLAVIYRKATFFIFRIGRKKNPLIFFLEIQINKTIACVITGFW